VSVVIVGVIRRKPVLTHASIVCEGMLASVNSVNSVNSDRIKESCVRWKSTGAERRCHGNLFWDLSCYNLGYRNDVY